MKGFRNVLVYANGADGGITALRTAAVLAERDSASVTVVDVVPELLASMKSLQEIMPVAEVESIAQKEVRIRLSELIKTIDAPNVTFETKVLIGKPYLALIRQVLVERHDLVLKTGERTGGLGNRTLGSTGQHLLRKCPCPVWIVKADLPPRSNCILAAVDVSTTEESEQRLNHDIVEMAAAQADKESSELHVVTNAALWMDSWLSFTDRETNADLNQIAKERAVEAQKHLDRLVTSVVGENRAKTHLLNGTPGATVPRLATDVKADLLVLGTAGRTGLSGFFMANTSEEILERADFAVLALKPPRYDTPVRVRKT